MEEMQLNTINLLNQHRLWLNLITSDNVFALDARIRRMLYTDIHVISGISDDFKITFPSDNKWQNKLYIKLVEIQRQHDAALQKRK